MKRLLTIASVAAFTLAACGGDSDISPDVLERALVAQGFTDEQAECVADDLSSKLDQEDFNEVSKADDLADIDPELEAVAIEAVTACLTGG